MKYLATMYVGLKSMMPLMLKNEKGATMVEYALMVALIAVFCITAVTAVGTNTSGTFTTIAGSL